MLTIKVTTKDIDGFSETHLFYGERITHRERESNNYQMEFPNEEKVVVIGHLPEKNSEHKFTYSDVWIYGDSSTPKMLLYILPYADCFIMDNGKTVDSFGAYYC